MGTYWQAVHAVFIRNAKLLIRQKQLILAPILLPVILMFLTAVIMGAGGDQWPVAVVDEARDQASGQLLQSIKDSRSNITPYYRIVETDLAAAREAVKKGRLHLMIRIPENYSQSRTVYIETFNINSDMMKNVRLRLEHSVNNLLGKEGELNVTPRLMTERPRDVWRVSFIGGSCLLLAIMLGSTITAANLFAFDQENRTKKEMILTPVRMTASGIGIVLSSVAASIVGSLPSLLIASLVFKMEIHIANLLFVYAAMIPVAVACSCIGLLAAHTLRYYRVIQPVIIVSAIATFFGAGGFASVTVLPQAAQTFSKYWVFSRIFEWFNPVLHQFQSSLSFYQMGMIGIAATLGLMLIPFIYQREKNSKLAGGQ